MIQIIGMPGWKHHADSFVCGQIYLYIKISYLRYQEVKV